jgi:hypothetical protein
LSRVAAPGGLSEFGGEDGGNTGTLPGSAADVRGRGNAAATGPFIRIAPGSMKRRSALSLTAAEATVLLAIAACSGSKPGARETSIDDST